jgi:very-short-patch-repair endonuclease
MSSKRRRRWRAPQVVQVRARQLRRETTPAEKRLWLRLRSGNLATHHFRRQHAVDRFIVDFFCAAAKLVIEVDGDSHCDRAEYDAERTCWLNEQKKYRVLRFTNDAVHENIEAVLEKIWAALNEPLS